MSSLASSAPALAVRPWLFDLQGRPVFLPARCIGFQVRYWPVGSRGPGELIRDPETGAPLLIAAEAAVEDFRAAVGQRPGRYQLAPMDAAFRPVRRTRSAQLVIGAPEGEAAAAPAPPRRTHLQLDADRFADHERRMIELLSAREERTADAVARVCGAVERLVEQLGALVQVLIPAIVPAAARGAAKPSAAAAPAAPTLAAALRAPKPAKPTAAPAAPADEDAAFAAHVEALGQALTAEERGFLQMLIFVASQNAQGAEVRHQVRQLTPATVKDVVREGMAQAKAATAAALKG